MQTRPAAAARRSWACGDRSAGARAAGHEQAGSPPPPPLARCRRPAARERQDGVHAATDLRPAGLPSAPSAPPPAPAG